jgi:hypothetical protein
MGSLKGSYQLNRDTISVIYNDDKLDPLIGLAEKPQDYSMLRFDLDFSSSDLERTDEFDLEEIIKNALQHMRSFLTENLVHLEKSLSNLLDCSILTKPSYVNDKNKRKYGVHGQFHNLFINKKDFEYFEDSVAPLISGFDKISKNAWLLYGQQKSEISGTYTISHVDVFGKKISPINYFSNYAIYDLKEQQIPFATPTHYYKQIFSIIPFNRECTDFKPRQEINPKGGEREVVEYVVPDDLSETLIEATKYVELLSSKRVNNGRKEWFYIGGILYSISDGDEAFFQLWNELSTKSVDYDEEECIRTWKSMKRQPKHGIHLLRKMAKFDSPNEFKTEESLRDKKEFVSMKLDNIHANEVINQNNIGSYLPRLAKSDIVFMRSNMMTFKTQNLKELLPLYKRILVVSFRVSLLDSYVDTFGGFDFKMYSDVNGKITEDKVFVQIDSLFRVIGSFELILFDEAVYTIEHLNSFVKRKHEVWDALTQQIQSAKKIIVCDALLDNATIDVFKKASVDEGGRAKKTWIVDNQWQSFKGKSIRYEPHVSVEKMITHITLELQKYGSIYIPTNSKTLADKLYIYFQAKGIRVGLDSSDNEPTPPELWRKNFDIFISTPTNVAGVSCNDAFGKTIGYCTNRSCNARMFAQMINRVRNTDSKCIDIFYKINVVGYNPTKTDDIKAWVKEKDQLMFSGGLKIDYIRDEIIEDEYYSQYISHLKAQNQSHKWYLQVLKGIMEHHGFESIDNDDEEEVIIYNEEALAEIKGDSKAIYEASQDEIRVAICNAKDISEEQYNEIKEKYQKTQSEKLQMRKFNIMKAYKNTISGDNRILTSPFIKKYEKFISHYYNLRELNVENPEMLKYYIEHQYNKFLSEHSHDPNTERLHENHRLLKLWTSHNIVNVLGFESIWDKKEITGYPYDKAVEFLHSHGHKISVLFGKNDKTKWKELDLEDSKVKEKITLTLNTVLKNVCSVGVKRKTKTKTDESYIIQGLEVWEKGDILIPKNEIASDLQKGWFYIENDVLHKRTDEQQQEWKKNKQKESSYLTKSRFDEVEKRTKRLLPTFGALFEKLSKSVEVN